MGSEAEFRGARSGSYAEHRPARMGDGLSWVFHDKAEVLVTIIALNHEHSGADDCCAPDLDARGPPFTLAPIHNAFIASAPSDI